MNDSNPFVGARIIGENIDSEAYHRRDPAALRGTLAYIMSRSELMRFAKCPSKWLAGAPDDSTTSTVWGGLIDTLALTPQLFKDRYAVTPETYPDKKTGEQKDWNWNATFCKEWRERQNPKECVKSDLAQEADKAVQILMADGDLSELIKCSKKQVMISAHYNDRATGLQIPVRALLDLVPDKSHERFGRSLADFKTAVSAEPWGWPKVVEKHGYDWQAAMYLDLYIAATGEDRIEWLHAVQENKTPYQIGRRHLSSEFVNLGRDKYRLALMKYAQCVKQQRWPGYDDCAGMIVPGFTTTEPASWMMQSTGIVASLADVSSPAVARPDDDDDDEIPNDFTP